MGKSHRLDNPQIKSCRTQNIVELRRFPVKERPVIQKTFSPKLITSVAVRVVCHVD